MRRALALCTAGLVAGCVHRPVPPPPVPSITSIKGPPRVAVVPFRHVGPPDDGVPADAGAVAARLLAAHLAALGFSVVEADRVAEAVTLAEAGTYDARFASRVAEKAGASLAAVGVLTRYHEREGTASAVESPASVAYQVALVRSDGTVLALDRFEHTQRAPGEEARFGEDEARWLTREEMLGEALARTADRLAHGVVIEPADSR